MIYVKRRGSDVWHFAKNCYRMPKTIQTRITREGTIRPGTGELCNECNAKWRKGIAVPCDPA